MKKIFTLICALMGFAGVANAATVDDLAPLKHSYVLVCDELGARPGAGALFGDDHFLDVKGGSTATNKGSVDLSVVDGNSGYVTAEIVAKYGEDYGGPHYNWLRLKNTQDMIAMKPTAGSKIIFFLQGNDKTGKEARYPKLSKKADLSDALNAAPTAAFTEKTVSGYRMEYTVPNDWGTNDVLYVGSYNGDMFVSFIIVEALEAEGTPSVKVGPQTFADGLWYREVTCKTVEVGGLSTVATYTTDGSTPTASSPVYTAPIKCYKNQTVKFQAFYDYDSKGAADEECEGADNEAGVNFTFAAPTIKATGATFTVTANVTDGTVKNYYKIGDAEAVQGDGATLSESATVQAYTVITNGSYGEFTTASVSTDVYVLTPISEKKTITVTAGTAVIDEESTADPKPYIIKEGTGQISADKAAFFVKNLTFGALANADDAKSKYQVPAGQEAYIMMSNTNISFAVAAGGKVDVKVTCSKNSCKNIDAADNTDDATTPVNDRKCYVTINSNGTKVGDFGGEDLKLNPDGNVIEFTLDNSEGTEDKVYTFVKYSGTGNILISSIEITPATTDGINAIKTVEKAENGVIYNIAGQKVDNNYKGIVIKNGAKYIQK